MHLTGGANGTSADGDFGESLEEPNCIDHFKHTTVKVGDVYFAENCLMCKCGAKEHRCQPLWCPPHNPCDGVITRDPRNCCDVCAPSVLLGNSIDHAGASLKLGGMTVTFLIIVSTIFFLLHRLRKKRLLITLRRCRSMNGGFHPFRGPLDRSCGSCRVSTSCPRSAATPASFVPYANYADPPPPYSMAVMVPLASRGAGTNLAMYSAPPPPYLSASRVTRSAENEACCSNGTFPRRSMPTRRSWPEFFVDRTPNWPLKRKASQEVLGSRNHVQGSCSISVVDTGSVSSTCSSSLCSSNCDCDAYSSEEQCSIYYDPSQGQQPSMSTPPVRRSRRAVAPIQLPNQTY